MTKLSILDLVFINQNSNASEALQRSLTLARRAEALGFERYWVAEHHNSPAIASAATSVVIGHLAGGTNKIRVGAGGIMLPNHSPMVIAEQFGTLEALYPGRIDLGLGRAPGTDQSTLRALRRDASSAQNFPQDVEELRYYLSEAARGGSIQAIPATATNVPLWILGSSTFGAQLAAKLGLPYAFASHFAPDSLEDALHIYRRDFRPSAQLQKPYVMAGVNVVAAETDEEAKFLFTSLQQAFADVVRSRRNHFRPPIENIDAYWSMEEKHVAEHMLTHSIVGSADSVRHGLKRFIAHTQADELMVVSSMFDLQKRIRSYEILATLL